MYTDSTVFSRMITFSYHMTSFRLLALFLQSICCTDDWRRNELDRWDHDCFSAESHTRRLTRVICFYLSRCLAFHASNFPDLVADFSHILLISNQADVFRNSSTSSASENGNLNTTGLMKSEAEQLHMPQRTSGRSSWSGGPYRSGCARDRE